MPNFDLKKISIPPSSPKHGQHGRYLELLKRRAAKRYWWRMSWSAVFLFTVILLTGQALAFSDSDFLAANYHNTSEIEKIRLNALSRDNFLPVAVEDPKVDALAEYLQEKNSPLASYAGIISRSPNWKLLVGIANAESNLCKKTDKNNCWGIGPGGPWTFEEISQSLYYANYLLTKFDQLGMDNPETLVRTYVGYHNPNWINAINDVFYELHERGLR